MSAQKKPKLKQTTSTDKKVFNLLLALIFLRPALDIISQREIAFLSFLPSFTLNLAIGGLVFVIGSFYLLKNLKKVAKIPLLLNILLFLGLCFISVSYSIYAKISFQEAVRLATIFILYFLAYLVVKKKKEFILILKVTIGSYLIPAFFALFQFITGDGIIDELSGLRRIYGTFAHSNQFAFYTAFILSITLSLLLTLFTPQTKSLLTSFKKTIKELKERENILKNKTLQFFLWPLAFLAAFLLFATYTRSALLCFVIFVLIIGIFKYKKIILVTALTLLCLYIFSQTFQEKVWDLFSLDPTSSVVWRLQMWRDMLPVAMWSPWLGSGAGTFNYLAEVRRGVRFGSLDAHNDYLKLLLENGVLGLLSYLLLIFALLGRLLKIFIKDPVSKTLAIGILAITLSVYLTSGFDNILKTTALQWNAWILFGAWLKINVKSLGK